jgi:PAS domain S-box-containing protein
MQDASARKAPAGLARLFNDLGVAEKVYGIVALFVALTVLLVVMAIQSVRLQATYREELAISATAALNIERVKGLIFAAVMESRGIYLSADTETAKPYANALLVRTGELEAALAQWQAGILPDDADRFAGFRRRIDQFIEFRRELVRQSTDPGFTFGREWGDNRASRRLRTALIEDIAALAEIYAARTRLVAELGDRTRLAALYLASLGGLAMSMAGFNIRVMRRFVLAPLSDITRATDLIAAGTLEIGIPYIERRDEIGRLAHAVQNFRDAVLRNSQLVEQEIGTAKQRDYAIRQRDTLNDKYFATKWQLSAAINNMPQGVIMLNASAEVLVINDRYRTIYGLPAEIKSGATLGDILRHREANGLFSGDISAYLAAIIARIARRVPSISEIELADGRVVRISEQPMAGGGWVATHEDFTEQRRMQRILERTERLLVTVIENIPEAIVGKDARDLRYIFINRAAERLFGLPRSEIIGRTARELFPVESAEMLERHDRDHIAENAATDIAAHVIDTPRSGRRTVIIRRMPVISPDGRSQILLSMIQDQTAYARNVA